MKKSNSIKKDLNNFITEGSADSVKDGIIGNYLIPFAMFLGANNEMIGIISSVPDMVALTFQTLSTKFIKLFGSKKKTCRFFKFIANLTWIPIILLPFLFPGGVWILLIILCIRYIFSDINDTTWSSWISDIVPKNIRGKFFGKRNMYAVVASFGASLFAGWILGLYNSAFGFTVIFTVAFFATLTSWYFLGKISDPPIAEHPKITFSFNHFIHGIMWHSNYSNFVLYRTLMNFTIQFVAPFWAVFVLRNLGIGYDWYAISIGVYMLANIVGQKYWGNMIDKFGEKKIMFVCSFLIPFGALIMLFVGNVWQLMLERILSGLIFSGFGIASFNYLLSASPSEDSSTFIANYKFFAGFGASLGAITGGFIVMNIPENVIFSLASIQVLFLIAFFMRMSVTAMFFNRLHSIRIKKHIAFRKVFIKTAFIYPISSTTHHLGYVINSIHRWEEKFKSTLFS